MYFIITLQPITSSFRFFGQEPPLMEWFLKNLGYEVTLNQIDMNQTFISFLISIGDDQSSHR